MRESYLFMLIFLLFLSCSKSKDEPIPEKFRGNWILVNGEKDVELKVKANKISILHEVNRDITHKIIQLIEEPVTGNDGSIYFHILFMDKFSVATSGAYKSEPIDTLTLYSSAFDVFSPSDSLISLKFIKK